MLLQVKGTNYTVAPADLLTETISDEMYKSI